MTVERVIYDFERDLGIPMRWLTACMDYMLSCSKGQNLEGS
jgi:hypothetical protein